MNLQSELDEKSDFICSQMQDQNLKRPKTIETNQALKNQKLAVLELKSQKTRKFYLKTIEVETIGGLPLKITTWCSDEKQTNKTVKRKEIKENECNVCGKTFDEKRKLLLHVRYHKPKDTETKIVEYKDPEDPKE